mmetsp:Transcript_15942/g.47941  ORF Transcript_15942/g.47941 Transcript_15942/m.47941 type:complete len:290 (+) Transcript_15942:252-1121(+)|eukprot:CAMPEP_0206144570 /NCGR_PEP_ID=MMETSP1473-20131121/24489_1 /ASSEMBLY_ACC=CAM_ASM_001109 /TAXON_ID=1461547 /ORGANISM="Stichococcus sp, Strain RCC1054" /LENGTH=289 /DNA_ID=CAMNT_0053540421 /DNA_START=235 /DNA_END=1104 /DNA_ORIENTATION=-
MWLSNFQCWGGSSSNDDEVALFDQRRQGAVIGRGCHGTVFKDNHCRTLAIKVVNLTENPNAEDEATVQEKLTPHPYIVQYHKHCKKDDQLYIHMERLKGGTLADLIVKSNTFPTCDVWQIAYALASALAFLHQNDIVHRDVRLNNVMLSSPGHVDIVKLGDFGLAARVGPDGRTPGENGYRPYSAPETFADPPWSSRASDMWALGCVLYTLLTGFRPFGNYDNPQLEDEVRAGRHTLLKASDHGEELRDLVENKLLQLNPSKRATSKEVKDICEAHLPQRSLSVNRSCF